MSVYILFLSRIIASFRFNVEECHISIFINIWLYRLIDLIVIMINNNMINIIIALYFYMQSPVLGSNAVV